MKIRMRTLLSVSILVLVSLACALPTSSKELGSEILSALETDSPIESDPGILFMDDFSDNTSGWDRYTDTDGITDYENGIYRINVLDTRSDYWANPGKNLSDVRIEVDATKAGGPDDNDIGVICRYKSVDDFYVFMISSDGYYGISKVVAGESELIGQESWLDSDAIKLGLDTNHIRVDCVGSQLSLYVNGVFITSVTDSEFSSGDVGLLAGTYDTPGTDIHFDNFVIYDPAVKK
jgi:hypothetical protein